MQTWVDHNLCLMKRRLTMSLKIWYTGFLSQVPNLKQASVVKRLQQEFQHLVPLAFRPQSSLRLALAVSMG